MSTEKKGMPLFSAYESTDDGIQQIFRELDLNKVGYIKSMIMRLVQTIQEQVVDPMNEKIEKLEEEDT